MGVPAQDAVALLNGHRAREMQHRELGDALPEAASDEPPLAELVGEHLVPGLGRRLVIDGIVRAPRVQREQAVVPEDHAALARVGRADALVEGADRVDNLSVSCEIRPDGQVVLGHDVEAVVLVVDAEQVLLARGEPARPGRQPQGIEPAAHHRRLPPAGFERVRVRTEPPGADLDVVVGENDDLGARVLDAHVARAAEVRQVERHVHQSRIVPESPTERGRKRPRAVLVDDDDLEVLKAVAQDARDAVQQKRLAAARRDHDGHRRTGIERHAPSARGRSGSRSG